MLWEQLEPRQGAGRGRKGGGWLGLAELSQVVRGSVNGRTGEVGLSEGQTQCQALIGWVVESTASSGGKVEGTS